MADCTISPYYADSDARTAIVHLNPFRYRGYYYDAETGWYYLQSRYYNPEWCRFISPDTLLSVGSDLLGTNLYIYCGNNPVNRVDYTGHFWDVVLDVLSLCISIGDVIMNPDDQWAWLALGIDTVCLVAPFATGGGSATRLVSAVDDVGDVVKTLDTVDDVSDVVKTFDKTEDITKTVKSINAIDNITTAANKTHSVVQTTLKFTPNQNAVLQLAKEAHMKKGISKKEADILWGWVQEYGLSGSRYHAPMFDRYLGGTQLHMKINGLHINIF